MKSTLHKIHKQHTFDCYCKKVLQNEANNGHRELNRRYKREILMSALPEEKRDQLTSYDDYFWEYSSFQVDGCSVLISDDGLAMALEKMTVEDRSIILMYWFLDMSDREIATKLGMARKTVNTHRRKALLVLKRLMKR